MLTLWAMRPVSNSMMDGRPTPTATVSSLRRCEISSTICPTSLSESETSVLTSSCVSSLPSSRVAEAIFVPPTSRPMNAPFTRGSSGGSTRAWSGCRRMPGKEAGRVHWRSPCPSREAKPVTSEARQGSQAPAAPVQVRGGPQEGPLELRRRGLVEEDEQRAGGRAHATSGGAGVGRLGEPAPDRLGLVGAGDEEGDLAAVVEDGEGQRRPRHLG